MPNIKSSIIIPSYNQYDSLCYVLKGFASQNVDMNQHEIIVVDDGSVDLLSCETSKSLSKKYKLNIEIIHQRNKGRSKSRNIGLYTAQSENLIFCDSDRIPHYNFVDEHLQNCNDVKKISIGSSYDYFGKKTELMKKEYDWCYIHKMSRIPYYYKKSINLIHQSKNPPFDYVWLSFLVGNSCVNKQMITEAGGFDESIKTWGFEHFELGYRLYKNNANFVFSNNAMNYHIPHKRPNNFYEEHITRSIQYLHKKHKEIDENFLYDFFNINVSSK